VAGTEIAGVLDETARFPALSRHRSMTAARTRQRLAFRRWSSSTSPG